ncbi:hypothetical protein AA103196_3082 [Ameyamaea chiangmaiensis NBRC 103196]|uniref:Succinylglutamate desuccinylase/aspartoacylase family protein n=1 Tax=Ameyamaea chiangmaiensis TaxID=442969 RepID=A0A850P6H4_9PROT|nr:succinylglutamate desuccinylase/aspartoacylase family protein [Ameyamaea chiangmaiensis]MBS4074567.1 succinylglutamate desuccinylase/aspartoacylase family protein [Ameyamaea chiangmaiensis]NVN39528.1 succinylglutamate desuccinylase/aspartoacylase family protein [Ameyamaea chiangmaiensis]GBQ72507.1 hypothetical protein AA103196_3082 [Ameyamaea chiangmaiensis NBRC 103196]
MSCGASPRGSEGPARVKASLFRDTLPPPPPPLPDFAVALRPPDLTRWERGNAGIPGVMHFETRHPGPHVVVSCLMHGNEYAGAVAVDRLLRRGVRPARGRLSFVFLNLAAFARFDRANPVASRFIDEDMNRLWAPVILDGSGQSAELDRAREVAPVLRSADLLLDLHTMLWAGAPIFLAAEGRSGAALASTLAPGTLVVEDQGHASGARLIDGAIFPSRDKPVRACLLEAGQHWHVRSAACSLRAVRTMLRHGCGIRGEASPATAILPDPRRSVRVTDTITARTSGFTFLHPFRNGDIIADGGTVLARDGTDEIRTPYNDCLLVMPNLRPGQGQTAVRLAHRVG